MENSLKIEMISEEELKKLGEKEMSEEELRELLAELPNIIKELEKELQLTF